MNSPEPPADEDAIRDALREVLDPEVGLNIVDLGLVYDVAISAERVHVHLTMTSAACPLGEHIAGNAREAIERVVPVGTAVEVELVWDPPWHPDMMTGAARERFG